MTPREIVHELDRHIIGQQDAKRAVAIALRNRWRRQQLPEALRNEVTPKNILMIGPTGVGKTEIARRLAGQGGVALAIDYGHLASRTGSTFQAIAQHQKVDPLAEPGTADLTAHVDFAALAEVGGRSASMSARSTSRPSPISTRVRAMASAESTRSGAHTASQRCGSNE